LQGLPFGNLRKLEENQDGDVIRDPREHPEAVLGDFVHPDPKRPFGLDRSRSSMGAVGSNGTSPSRGDDYYPLPAQWDIKKGQWLTYHVEAGTDWWVPFYEPSNFDRPTGPTCDGCHSVNYDIKTKQVTEWNVGCEKCHGPGSLHVQHPTRQNIVNPASLDFVRGNDTCIQCHSQGQPLHNPIAGKYYDCPVGFLVWERLADYWKLEELKPGQTDFYQYPDLTAHKNRCKELTSFRAICITVSCAASIVIRSTGTVTSRMSRFPEMSFACHAIPRKILPD
jgi:hypothetical protein